MKATFFFFSFFFVLTFSACTASDDVLSSDEALLDIVKNTYGAETALLSSVQGNQEIPSITLKEVEGVLEALRQGNHAEQNCAVVTSSDKYFGSSNEVVKKVMMGNNYRAMTRTGSLLEDFILRVELNFSIENGQVYYFGTDYAYDSDLFMWRANGLSLAPAKNADGFTYAFESKSYLYFKVTDENNCLIKVPIVFKGNYNFKSEKGTYSFQLLKCQ